VSIFVWLHATRTGRRPDPAASRKDSPNARQVSHHTGNKSTYLCYKRCSNCCLCARTRLL